MSKSVKNHWKGTWDGKVLMGRGAGVEASFAQGTVTGTQSLGKLDVDGGLEWGASFRYVSYNHRFYLLTPSGLKQIGLLAGPSWIKKQNILPGCNLIGSIYRSVSILTGVHLKPVGMQHLKTVEVNELGKPFIASPLKSICSLQGCGKDSMPSNCS